MDTAFQVAVQGRALDALSGHSFLPVGTGNFRGLSIALNELFRAGYGGARFGFAKAAANSATASTALASRTGC